MDRFHRMMNSFGQFAIRNLVFKYHSVFFDSPPLRWINCCFGVNYSKRTESIGASARQNTPRWAVTHPLSPVTGITYAAVFTGVHTFLVHPNALISSALRSDRSPCLILDIRLQVCFLKFLRSLYGRYQSCMFTVSVVRYR